jgi:hypothetical protein
MFAALARIGRYIRDKNSLWGLLLVEGGGCQVRKRTGWTGKEYKKAFSVSGRL